MLTVDRDRCTSCSECARVCAVQAIGMVDGFPQLKPDNLCVKCEDCVSKCPEGAIELTMDRPY